LKISYFNELAYTELILSINVRTISGKVAFNMTKGWKNKDYREGDASVTWGLLENKFEQTSAPSLVKTERKFRQSFLCNYEDLDLCITNLKI
jgi:hypothetical protein